MPYTNYRDSEHKIRKFKDFKGNSWHAETTDKGEYCVFSRRTIIAYANPRNRTLWVNPRYYSVTTKRQTNIIRRQWDSLDGYTHIGGDL